MLALPQPFEIKDQLTSLGFVFSTSTPTATPVLVFETSTELELSVVTPTPTAFLDPTNLAATISTTLGVETTMTETIVSTQTIETTELPAPTPVLSICSPFFYTNATDLYWIKEAQEMTVNPYFNLRHCQVANITSAQQARDVSKNLCENVFVLDGLKHSPGFTPFQCPILSPNAIVKQPRLGCDSTFRTLCYLQV